MPSTTAYLDMTGRQKAAVLLMALGIEKSALVMKHLREEEVETISHELANTPTVMPEDRDKVLEEFYNICLAQQYITEGGINYAQNVLEKAMGTEKAYEIISKLSVRIAVRPFDKIRKTEPQHIYNFIQNEHAQTIALILAYLRPKQAAEVIGSLEPDKQADVARRMATMQGTSPDVIKEVESVFEKKLSALMTDGYEAVGGIESVVEILNAVDRSTEKRIMETLEVDDIELAEEIRRRMFVFEDMLALSSRDMQLVLKEVDQKDIAVALKGTTDEMREHVYRAQSKRVAAMIQEEMDFLGPIRRSDMEEAQQKIVNIVRRLQDSGELIVARGGGEDVIF